MSLRYEIEYETNAVRVFYPNSDVASLFQPNWPNGDAWADAAEATSWAELYVASIEDEYAPYAPNSRGETGRAKPTASQKAAIDEALESLKLAVTPAARQAAQDALRIAYETI
jgi:hypothetical protein